MTGRPSSSSSVGVALPGLHLLPLTSPEGVLALGLALEAGLPIALLLLWRGGWAAALLGAGLRLADRLEQVLHCSRAKAVLPPLPLRGRMSIEVRKVGSQTR